MKIFKRFKLFTAATAGTLFALAVAARAEFTEGDDPRCFYVRCCAAPRSSSDVSRKAASARAEAAAYEEFLRYATGENLKLPEALEHLRSRLAEVAVQKFAAGTIIGREVIKRETLADGSVRCTVKIPKENLKRITGLDFRSHPERVLDFCRTSPTLKYETAAILGKENAEMLFGNRTYDVAAWENGIFESVPETWFVPGNRFDTETLQTFSDSLLLNLWLASAGTAPCGTAIATEFEKRGLRHVAKRLATLTVPHVKDNIAGAEFLKKISGDGRGSALAQRLVEEDCTAIFRMKKQPNRDFADASAEFSQKEPDYKKMISLLEKSLQTSVSDDAFNLLGRAYEALGDDFSAAAVYAQAVSLNPKTPYARANLAGTLQKLGDSDSAEFWANAVLDDPKSNPWSKNRAEELLREISPEAGTPADSAQPQ